ncbi:MAG TPA: DUF1080 domain-containing protein [Bryobacteraceae bacterium]|nr:DUF1080 domain-containing protein [Bryobacteraceae bacterium]
MKPLCFVLTIAAALLAPARSQAAKNPFLGRWDLTVTSPHSTANQWMEIVEKDGRLDGRIQPGGGAVRAIVGAKMDGSHLIITVTPAGRGPETTWDLTTDGSKVTGVQKRGDASDTQIAGVRAPDLQRPMPEAWTDPEPLFNGKDLTGWEPVGDVKNSHWLARDGELVNDNPAHGGANIKTTRKFDDFKLHAEVNCPEGGNSGIYLRGRYEIQVGTEGGTVPSHEMGAVYGHFAPAAFTRKLGEWSTFDITFVGRTVTVIRDGVKIHDNVEIPGITGGALDSNEGEPGPFFLQGDHQGVIRYRNITVSVPKR